MKRADVIQDNPMLHVPLPVDIHKLEDLEGFMEREVLEDSLSHSQTDLWFRQTVAQGFYISGLVNIEYSPNEYSKQLHPLYQDFIMDIFHNGKESVFVKTLLGSGQSPTEQNKTLVLLRFMAYPIFAATTPDLLRNYNIT